MTLRRRDAAAADKVQEGLEVNWAVIVLIAFCYHFIASWTTIISTVASFAQQHRICNLQVDNLHHLLNLLFNRKPSLDSIRYISMNILFALLTWTWATQVLIPPKVTELVKDSNLTENCIHFNCLRPYGKHKLYKDSILPSLHLWVKLKHIEIPWNWSSRLTYSYKVSNGSVKPLGSLEISLTRYEQIILSIKDSICMINLWV